MFEYPNQNKVLLRNTESEEMSQNLNKTIRFWTYNKKGFPTKQKTGKIISVVYPDYIVSTRYKKYLVSKDDYITIF